MKSLAIRLLSLGYFLIRSSLALAQTEKMVYDDCFPPMPELPGGGGVKAIIMAIQRRVVYPPIALRADITGRVFVTFVVTPAGEVTQVAVIKSLDDAFDSAAVSAVRQLPRFQPRLQKYGSVRYNVPISFQIGQASRATRKAAHRRNSTR